MIKWIKDKIDAFLCWIDKDMNLFFVVMALIGIICLGIMISVFATGGTINQPNTQPIIYLPLMR